MPDIAYEIASWDGKFITDISVIYTRHAGSHSFAANLIFCMKEARLQRGATWLLKKHLENGGTLPPTQIGDICELLPKLEHWESKLHILQCFTFLPIPSLSTQIVEIFVRNCLSTDKIFVRAWAYNVFYLLSVQYPRYRPEVYPLLEAAMISESPSVKARIRNIMKKGFGYPSS